jgi:hypothetical protein
MGTSPPRNPVNYPATPPVFAPSRVLCGNSAVHSARVPPHLVKGGRNAELIEFTHLLRSTDFIMWHCGVNRSGWAEAVATPRAQSALGCRTGSPRARPGRRAGIGCARILGVQIFCDRRGRIALEVPPSDAKLPLNCQLLDGFVDIPPVNLGVNPCASFCGIWITGALWFSHWAITAVVLRVQK